MRADALVVGVLKDDIRAVGIVVGIAGIIIVVVGTSYASRSAVVVVAVVSMFLFSYPKKAF